MVDQASAASSRPCRPTPAGGAARLGGATGVCRISSAPAPPRPPDAASAPPRRRRTRPHAAVAERARGVPAPSRAGPRRARGPRAGRGGAPERGVCPVPEGRRVAGEPAAAPGHALRPVRARRRRGQRDRRRVRAGRRGPPPRRLVGPRRGRDDPGREPGLGRRAPAHRREPGHELYRVRPARDGPGRAPGRRRGRALGDAHGGDPAPRPEGAGPLYDPRRRVRRRRLEHGVGDGLRRPHPARRRHLPRPRAAPAGGDGRGVRRRVGRVLGQPPHRHRRPPAGRDHAGGGPTYRPGLRGPRGGQLLLHGREHLPHRGRGDVGDAPVRRAPARDVRPLHRERGPPAAADGPALAGPRSVG